MAGKEHLAELIDDGGPQAWSDEGFGVHLAFFSRTNLATRLRILEGRRRQVEERRERLRTAMSRAAERLDQYTYKLHQLGLEATDREVGWLNELIADEQTTAPLPEPEPEGIARTTRPAFQPRRDPRGNSQIHQQEDID